MLRNTLGVSILEVVFLFLSFSYSIFFSSSSSSISSTIFSLSSSLMWAGKGSSSLSYS